MEQQGTDKPHVFSTARDLTGFKTYRIPIIEKDASEEEGICITIPEGRIGELRCAFKAGCDCMGVIYARPESNEVHVIGNCHDGTQTGDRANHRFPSGNWNMWVYNKTRSRFETMMKKSVHMKDGSSSFVLGATHRISATQKTCIVCVMDMVPDQAPPRNGKI